MNYIKSLRESRPNGSTTLKILKNGVPLFYNVKDNCIYNVNTYRHEKWALFITERYKTDIELGAPNFKIEWIGGTKEKNIWLGKSHTQPCLPFGIC